LAKKGVLMKNTIINVAAVNNNTVINDHTGYPIAIIGLCVLKSGKVGVLLDTDKYYSINEYYVDKDGVAHLGTRSITGTVEPGMDMTTEEGIAAFNSTITFESRYIRRVILLITPSMRRKPGDGLLLSTTSMASCIDKNANIDLFRCPLIP
jgi:hypothetical protein